MSEQIIGTGSAFPGKKLRNSDLEALVDTSDEWIRSRTGIHSRHIAETETAADLAAEAAKNAIEDAGISPEEIDQIVVATASAELLFPCTACQVQAAIGAERASCFDLNAACSGFLTAYQLAVAQLRTGMAKTVLLIGTETMSRLVDYTDRSTCILFGDGAGAVLVRENPEKNDSTSFSLQADGKLGQALTCSCRADARYPGRELLQMDGAAIYKFAVKKVPESIQELLKRENYKSEDISFYILHQANTRIIDSIARHLGEPLEKFPTNLAEHGNISSASIPTLLDQLKREGKLKRGMRLVLAGFGAGLTWGSALLEW